MISTFPVVRNLNVEEDCQHSVIAYGLVPDKLCQIGLVEGGSGSIVVDLLIVDLPILDHTELRHYKLLQIIQLHGCKDHQIHEITGVELVKQLLDLLFQPHPLLLRNLFESL